MIPPVSFSIHTKNIVHAKSRHDAGEIKLAFKHPGLPGSAGFQPAFEKLQAFWDARAVPFFVT